jgi:hypothetical protein
MRTIRETHPVADDLPQQLDDVGFGALRPDLPQGTGKGHQHRQRPAAELAMQLLRQFVVQGVLDEDHADVRPGPQLPQPIDGLGRSGHLVRMQARQAEPGRHVGARHRFH